jgi:hypothetical protein
MPFQEQLTWVNAVVTAVVGTAYSVLVFGQLGDMPATEIAYRWPLLIAVGALIVLTIVGTILMAIGTAVTAEITGTGSVDDIGRKDERDKRVGQRGTRAAYAVTSAGGLLALGLAMLEYDPFWIANALFLTFVVAGLVSATVRLLAYRRGF